MRQTLRKANHLFLFFALLLWGMDSFAFGSRKPSKPKPPIEEPPPPVEPPPVTPPNPVNSGMSENYFLEAEPEGFSVESMGELGLRPSCLKQNGVDLIILDGGHDDSAASTRSDAKVRGGNGRYVILWPEVHEGQLNMLTAWLAYDLMLKDESLSDSEREELQTMLRFTRHPGERVFGTFERSFGYYSSTQGTIDSGVGNRKNRTNFMMKNHRVYDSGQSNNLSRSFRNVTSRSVVVSVHANSSEYYNEGDVSWVIPPKNKSFSSPTKHLQRGIVRGMNTVFGSFYTPTQQDSREVASLKNSLKPTVEVSRILTRDHPVNLAMLSTGLGNSSTVKLLLEGFVMNGKAGNLARKQILEEGKKMHFKRNGSIVQSYSYSDLYLTYAQSLVRGLSERYSCE